MNGVLQTHNPDQKEPQSISPAISSAMRLILVSASAMVFAIGTTWQHQRIICPDHVAANIFSFEIGQWLRHAHPLA